MAGELTADKIKEYSANSARVASAIEGLMRHDGWQIFLALYDRRKEDIRAKADYASLEDFKADRRAIEIVDEIIEEFKGFVADAAEAAAFVAGLPTEEEPRSRGIMLIESMEGREQS